MKKASFSEATKTASSPQVLYEDNHVIAVYKPAGLLTQGDRSGVLSLMDWVRDWLRQKYRKTGNVFLGLVHRLDREVSGIVVFGKTSKGASRLSESFRTRQVRKIYWALVEGKPPEPKGELIHSLERDGKVQEAQLWYHVLEEKEGYSLLEIELGTGRKHQIRQQLALVGCPVVGDRRYGSRMGARDRILLVAKRLEFAHPVDRVKRAVIELPSELCVIRSGRWKR